MDHEEWIGWMFAGKHLVSPQRQRVTASVLEQLIGMHHARMHFETVGLKAQADAAKQRRRKRVRQVVKVLVIDLDDWRDGHRRAAG